MMKDFLQAGIILLGITLLPIPAALASSDGDTRHDDEETIGQSSSHGQQPSEGFIDHEGFWHAGTQHHRLQVTIAGTGTGIVMVEPGSFIWRGRTGVAFYKKDTQITLSATAGPDSTFVGWSGACTGAGACTVTMGSSKNVKARFVVPDKIGFFRNGTWFLDVNRSRTWDGPSADSIEMFGIGQVDAVPVAGDWNGDGITDLGVFYGIGMWRLDTNGNGIWDPGVDAEFRFGMPGDLPVAGDWNGDGVTDVGVFRGNGNWYLDTNGSRSWELGVDSLFKFGITGDMPVAGDWNNDGTTEVGVFRENGDWYLDLSGDRDWGAGDVMFRFGIVGDMPVTGDWNADGVTDVGVLRGNGDWFLDMNGDRDWVAGDKAFKFGIAGDRPVAGNW